MPSRPPASGSRTGRRGLAGRLLALSWARGARLLSNALRPRSVAAAPDPAADLAIYGPEAETQVALVTLLGLDAQDRAAALDAATATLGRSHRIVCVTDASPFTDLRRAGALVEHVPARDRQLLHAPELPWSDYLQDRHELLIAKWQPQVLLAYGDSFERLIEQARAYERRLA